MHHVGPLSDDRVLSVVERTRARNFLLAFLLSMGFIALAIVSINVIVDPFGRFGLVSVPGFNSQKPDLARAARMAKAQIVCRLQPSTVFLGTSRVEVGLDPSGIEHLPGTEYNLALAGSGLAEIDMMLRHSINASPNLTDVFIGLDFLMFNANREGVVFGTEVFGFDQERLMLSSSDTCWEKLLRDADMFLGVKGLYHSWRTVTRQLSLEQKAYTRPQDVGNWKSLYNDLGFRDQFDAVDAIIRKVGVRRYIGARAEAGYVATVWRPAPRHRYCFAATGQPNTLTRFRDLVRFSYESKIRLHLMINPVHARMLVALRRAGLWPQYEEWKRSLVRILEEESRGQARRFVLWDFSGFNTVTREPVPPEGDQTPVAWFWDPSHYKKAVGDMMLARVLDEPVATAVPDDFGLVLTADNIEAFVVQTRKGLSDYDGAFPGEVAFIEGAVDGVLRGSFGSNCGLDEDMLQAGIQALHRGESAEAERLFATAEEEHEKDRSRYAAIGAPFREDGFERNLKNARLGREVELTASTWKEYFARAEKRVDNGDISDGIEDYSQAINIAAKSVKPRGLLSMYFRRADAYVKSGKLTEAASDYRHILSVDPTNSTVMGLLDKINARIGSLAAGE